MAIRFRRGSSPDPDYVLLRGDVLGSVREERTAEGTQYALLQAYLAAGTEASGSVLALLVAQVTTSDGTGAKVFYRDQRVSVRLGDFAVTVR